MTVKQHFNKIYYEEFIDLAMLNDFECNVLKLRIKGETIVGIAMKLNCCETKVKETIKVLNQKYKEVQQYSKTLPKDNEIRL